MGLLSGIIQALAITAISLLLAIPMGEYLASVFGNKRMFLDKIFNPVERLALLGLRGYSRYSMGWQEYLAALLLSNLVVWLFALVSMHVLGMSPDLAFHTASSFTANTDQQHYRGETAMPAPGQMLVITTLMFFSAATGLASAFALIRSFTTTDGKLGNFFIDVVKGILRVLLPLSIAGSILLAANGVPQMIGGKLEAKTLSGETQSIPLGPVASLEAIKFLGTNGGGYYGANSAHPFENPSPLTNIIEILSVLLIPFSLPYTFGIMTGKRRQGLLILAVMASIFLVASIIMMSSDSGNPGLSDAISYPAGYLEGKEQRFSAFESVLFIAANTYVQCGGTSCAISSMMPAGVLGAMSGMVVQCAPGGIGTGLAIMLIYVLLSVFVAGLMVGRTPEFLGKKIDTREMKLVVTIILLHPALILMPTALTILLMPAHTLTINPGARGFSEIMYEFLSASANNGSGMGGLNNSSPYFNILSGIIILLGRFIPISAIIGIAGLFSAKRPIEATRGTLPTDNLTFGVFLVAIILIVGALSFLPVLALGPLAEIFSMGVKLW